MLRSMGGNLPYVVDYATQGFYEVMFDLDERQSDGFQHGDFDYLHGYLDAWLNMGGTDDTGGNFGTYMRVVSQIVTEYMENPHDGILAYSPESPEFRPRQIRGVVNWELPGSRSLDPENYQLLTFRRLGHAVAPSLDLPGEG